MANQLGINVKVNFQDAGQLQADFEKKIGKDGLKAKVNLTINKNSINSLKGQVKGIFGKEKFEINAKFNNKEMMNSLNAVEKKIKSLREQMSKPLDMNTGKGMKASNGIMTDTIKNSKMATKYVGDANAKIGKMYETANKTGSVFDKMAKTQSKSREALDKYVASMEKMGNKANEVNANDKKSADSATQKVAKLKEMAAIMKQINALEVKKIGGDTASNGAIEKRISSLKSMLGTLQTDFQKTFKEDYSNSSILKNVQSIGEMQKSLRQVAVEKKNLADADKIQNDRFNDLIQMENKRYQLIKKSQNAGEQESSALLKQADEMQKQAKFYNQQHRIIEQSTVGQARKLNLLAQESEMVKEISNARKRDKAVDNSYKELKGDLKQIYNLHSQINDIKARQDAKVSSSNDESKLKALQKEVEVRERIYNARKRQAMDDGHMTDSSSKSLKNAERELQTRNKIQSEVSKANAQMAKQQQAYSQVASQIKKIDSLQSKLSGASRHEADAIRRVISAEEAKTNAIMNSAKAQGNLTKQAEAELRARMQATAEERKAQEHINQGKQLDNDMNQFSMQQMFNPRTVIANARQAFQEMYDSVEKVDSKIVDIQKVADVPDAAIKDFTENVYDYASQFGVSADGYAEAVGRWVTTGKTLSESVELANASVMGSFVGNIGEEEMVKYMAVPLNAFKKDMLEANDVINAMNEVSNNNAVEMDDLGKAYERAGSTAAQAGTSFSELTGMITGAQEATYAGGEKIGTALKAVDVNFGKISSRLQKGDQQKFDFFKDIGVDVTDANDELRSSFDILNDLSEVWDSLSATEKSTAGMYAAGKNHSAIFSGLLENWETVKKAAKEAQGQVELFDKTSGSAFGEFATQQDSVAFKANELKNAWDELMSTIAGGKDGINSVLEGLTKGLQKASDLAKNPALRKIGKGALKMTAIMTATTAASQFFKVISSGTLTAISGMGKVLGMFSKVNREARRQKKISAATDLANAGGGKAMKGIAGGAAKASSKIAGLIPIIGGVISVLGILDAMGLPVFETIGKGISKLTNRTSKAKESLSEFNEEQKKINKSLQENSILNGDLEKADDVIKSYNKIKEVKTKAYKQSGNKNDLSYSPEEFEKIKKQFNGMAEALGFDLKITWNNYDHIESQFQKLLKMKDALNEEQAEKLGEALGKKGKYKKDFTTADEFEEKKRKAFEKESKEALRQLEQAQKFEGKNGGKYQDKAKKRLQDAEDGKARYDDFHGDYYQTKEFKEAEKANKQRIKELRSNAEQLSKAAQAGTLQKGFSSMDETAQKNTLAALASELPLMNKKKQAMDDLHDRIKKGQNLTLEDQQLLTKLNADYANLGDKIQGTDEKSQATKQGILEFLEAQSKSAGETQTNLENAITQLHELGDLSSDEAAKMIEVSREGGLSFVEMMSKYGEMGQSLLGVTQGIRDRFGEGTSDAIVDIQKQIEEIPEEKVTKYNLVQENGVANFEEIDKLLELPDDITTRFNIQSENSDTLNVKNAVEMLDQLNAMPPEVIKSLGIKTNKDGLVDVKALQDAWDKLKNEDERKEFIAKLTANTDGVDGKVEETKNKVEEIDGKEGKAKIGADSSELDSKVEESKSKTAELDGKEASTKHKADNSDAVTKVSETKSKTESLNGVHGTVKGKAETSDANTKIDSLFSKTKQGASGTVRVTGVLDGLASKIMGFFGRGSLGTISGTIKATVLGGGGGKGKGKGKNGSVVTSPNIGKSMSVGVGASAKAAKSKSTKSKGSSKDQKVDEDVWRYWAKELFKGTPLERSMNKLDNSIKMAGENQDKLIDLYKKQISVMNQQIAYNKDMKNAKQSELNSVMRKLRGKGFRTNGNKITNFERAKAFKGDGATEVNELLRKYKDLYQSIDQLGQKVESLNVDKFEHEEKIKKAQIEKELKAIEKTLKRQEALMKSIENRNSLQSAKNSMVSDGDVELKLAITEETLNTSRRNVSDLINEFNRLSTATVKHGENAEVVKGKLEEMKSEIISSSDAILDQREALNSLNIHRLINDYERFTSVIDENLSKLNANIEHLKDGLIDGSKYSDLLSSSLSKPDFTRKSKLEKEQEERLKLEARLDDALNKYAQKNIDRVGKVANATLKIEANKYKNLLKMANGYSNGKSISTSVKTPELAIGQTGKTNSSKNKSYDKWLDKLKKANDSYAKSLSAIQKNYEKVMSSSKSQNEKDAATNKFIVEQLKLQEKIYRNIVSINADAIKQAEAELKNTSLTTDQREQLIDAIEKYKKDSMDAQNSIKQTINSRFEFEFSLLDKAKEKADRNLKSLEHLLDIANAVNSTPESKEGLLENIYEAKLNQYATAKKELDSLLKQQSKLSKGSFEWNILDERILDVAERVQDLTSGIIAANKQILENTLDIYKEASEKNILGTTLDKFKDERDKWLTGISKELELEKLRMDAADLESEQIDKKLEMLDRQDKISKKDTEYISKQLKVLELQKKLSNVEKERNIQTFVKGDDGTWGYSYDVDQTNYDKTKEELNQAQKDLEDFKQSQRESYASDLNSIIDKAKSGDFESVSELKEALESLKSSYEGVLNDIPDVSFNNIDEVIKAYEDYIKKNKDVISKITDGKENGNFNKKLDMAAERFEKSFKDIASDVGKAISDSLINALRMASKGNNASGQSYTIQNQVLEFPNVTDSSGIEDMFRELPRIVEQQVRSK